MFEPAMLIGLGTVAIWLHVRFPRVRPRSLVQAIAHVAISFGGFALLPAALGALLPLFATHTSQLCAGLALLMAIFTYVLLSWIWLIARILHDLLGGTPRGGHPATNES